MDWKVGRFMGWLGKEPAVSGGPSLRERERRNILDGLVVILEVLFGHLRVRCDTRYMDYRENEGRVDRRVGWRLCEQWQATEVVEAQPNVQTERGTKHNSPDHVDTARCTI